MRVPKNWRAPIRMAVATVIGFAGVVALSALGLDVPAWIPIGAALLLGAYPIA